MYYKVQKFKYDFGCKSIQMVRGFYCFVQVKERQFSETVAQASAVATNVKDAETAAMYQCLLEWDDIEGVPIIEQGNVWINESAVNIIREIERDLSEEQDPKESLIRTIEKIRR